MANIRIKIDKEMLLKHRFWIMIGVAVVFTASGMAYLHLYGGEEAAKAQKDLKVQFAKIRAEKGEKGQEDVKGIGALAEKAKANEVEIWSKAYKAQEQEFHWQKDFEQEYNYFNGKFAREVRISQKVDSKTWNPDTDTVMHGLGKHVDQEGRLVIVNRKGEEVTFHRFDREIKVTRDGKNEKIGWADIQNLGIDQLLTVTYQAGKFFNEPLTTEEKDLYGKTYAKQVRDILQMVDPLRVDGKGVVQLRDYGFREDDNYVWDEAQRKKNRFIRIIGQEWDMGARNITIRPDVYWIAQENMWIQKEIYRIIATCNDNISVFVWLDKDGKPEKAPLKDHAKKIDSPYQFKNATLELELTLDGSENLAMSITNLLDRRQKFEMTFLVKMEGPDADAEELRISGPPLGPKEKRKVEPSFAKGAKPRTGIYGVKQQLSWETAAIKRIDYISIGADFSPDAPLGDKEVSHSHKTYPHELRAYALAVKPAEPPPDKEKPGAKPGEKPVPPPVIVPEFKGRKRTMIEYDLWLERYVDVTPQYRRLPVAMVLIVDQDYVDRILTAFNNSRFRFLQTQVLLNHYEGSLEPEFVKIKKTAEPVIGEPIKGEPPSRRQISSGESEANMELVIYGYMTLYQRYPPKGAGGPLPK